MTTQHRYLVQAHVHFRFLEQGTDEDASVCHSVVSTCDPNPAAKQAHRDTWPSELLLIILHEYSRTQYITCLFMNHITTSHSS